MRAEAFPRARGLESLPDFRQRHPEDPGTRQKTSGPAFDTPRTDMMRFVAIVVLASLPWPAVGFCLTAGRGAMPCCVERETGAPPVLRSCCGPAESSPATVQLPATAIQAPVEPVSTVVMLRALLGPSSARRARPVFVDIRLLNSVFLI